jgi:hypothetical protein
MKSNSTVIALLALRGGSETRVLSLAGIDASFDFDFNDYLHSASLCAAPRYSATARNLFNPRSLSFSGRKLSHLFRNHRVPRFRK